MILLVEDSVQYYSRFLSLLYSHVLDQTRRLIEDVTGDATGSIGFLPVFDGEGKEIPRFGGSRSAGGRRRPGQRPVRAAAELRLRRGALSTARRRLLVASLRTAPHDPAAAQTYRTAAG